MSIQKKSLISNRIAVKKALIASQPAEFGDTNPLKANSLTAQSMKKKKNMVVYKAFRAMSFKKR
ncbi:MAG: hypothetical protein WB660_29800 [Candidatus Sulfotelmatobacter sp.]